MLPSPKPGQAEIFPAGFFLQGLLLFVPSILGLDAAAAWGRDKENFFFFVGCLMNNEDQNKGF